VAIIVLVVFTAALDAWIPGAAALAWVMIGLTVVQSFFGGLLNLLDAINELDPFWWIGHYPSSPLQLSHLGTLGTLGTAGSLGTAGIVLLALSVAGFRRRDLRTS